MTTVKLTKSGVEKLTPEAGEVVIWDAELPGFGVRVKTSGVKSYVVQYRHRETGTSRRKTIGQHGLVVSKSARSRNQSLTEKKASGPSMTRDRSTGPGNRDR